MKGPVLCLLLCLASTAFSQDGQDPDLTGYVTRVASATDFDINGWHILCTAHTLTAPAPSQAFTSGCPQPTPYLGMPMEIFGSWKRKQHALVADRLIVKRASPKEFASYGIVEAVLSRSTQSTEVRADGYTILITNDTKLKFGAPLHSLSDIRPDIWLDYKGIELPDGRVHASTAWFTPDLMSSSAAAERARTDYDPSQTTAQGHPFTEALIGANAKKIPAWPDAAMEARVSAIGHRLIPACQLSLSASDPIRINFRFQVTAGDPFLEQALALPSGIILVPHQIVERLQNDAQLAAVLADAIAIEIEAQDSRMDIGVRPTKKRFARDAAIDTGEILAFGIPGTLVANGVTEAHDLRQQEEQTGRVSLDLMHEAGYDITQAPLAWWLLAPGDPKPIADIRLPARAAYLYSVLGTTWQGAIRP